MLHKIEKTGKNVDEALAKAAAELGVDVSEVGYEVTMEVGKGLIGLLVKKEATIEAWLKKDEPKKVEKPKVAPKSAKFEKPKSSKPVKVDKKADKQPKKVEPKVEKPAPQIATASGVMSLAKISKPRVEREPREITPVTNEDMQAAEMFLSELLNKMDIEHQLKIENVDNRINIDVSGEKMGLLIGKRGDTLDAVQYLTSLYINKDKKGYVKLNIDTENYREKREETLIRLAKRLERKVITSRKSVTLEPMSPYERRIIHAALQNSRGIKTYSVGSEPNRKIVIALG